jgi:hypothetical protein
MEGDFNLGDWVRSRRASRDNIAPDRKKLLESVGFVWEVLDTSWEDDFASLEVFAARESHCQVPIHHLEGHYRLGQWVSQQRRNENKLAPDRKRRLDALGFVWDPHDAKWMVGFASLKEFRARVGHCHAPFGHVENGYPLGRWVATQRDNRDRMPARRREQLDALGFRWR